MAPTYDSVGPSTGIGAQSTTSPASWTHTLVATTNSVVLAWGCLDAGTDTGYTLSATCGGTPMNAVASGTIHSNGGTAGFGTLWQLTGVGSGAKTIVVTAGGTGTGLDAVTGGSIGFIGADQTSPVGAVTSHVSSGPSANPSGASGANTNGNILAGFLVGGARASAETAGTLRFTAPTLSTEAGAGGHSAGGTAPATGSAVTFTWTVTSDWWGMVIVEVLPPSAAAAVVPPMTRGISMWR